MTFAQELEQLINKHSMESQSDTPDFILAIYLQDCLRTWTKATQARDAWYDRHDDNVKLKGKHTHE